MWRIERGVDSDIASEFRCCSFAHFNISIGSLKGRVEAKPTPSTEKIDQPPRILGGKRILPSPSPLDDGMSNDLSDTRSRCRIRLHTLYDQVGECGREWR